MRTIIFTLDMSYATFRPATMVIKEMVTSGCKVFINVINNVKITEE